MDGHSILVSHYCPLLSWIVIIGELRRSRESVESDKSEGSDRNEVEYEDDPNKLWCICNKPHNNRYDKNVVVILNLSFHQFPRRFKMMMVCRFMICCDACDNWFHGYCVGITKAMGKSARAVYKWNSIPFECVGFMTGGVYNRSSHYRGENGTEGYRVVVPEL